MARYLQGRNGGANSWLPPRFDVGVDGYNRNKSGAWRSFDSIFQPALHVARDRAKPLYVIEPG